MKSANPPRSEAKIRRSLVRRRTGKLANCQPNYPSCQQHAIYATIQHQESSIQHQESFCLAFCVLRLVSSIFVEYPLQIAPLLCKTNPISKTAKIVASPVPTKDYENEDPPAGPKNKPKRTQTNPKQTQFFARQSRPNPKQTQNKANRARSLRMTCSKSSNRMTNRRWVNIGVWFPGRATMPKKGDCEGTALLIDSPALLRMNKKFCAVTYRTQQPAERTVKITARGHYAEHFSA